MRQLVLRLLFWLTDIVGNAYILSTHQVLTLGDSSFDYGQFIVLFNAAMIMVIYFVDFVMYKTQKTRINLAIGEGMTHTR